MARPACTGHLPQRLLHPLLRACLSSRGPVSAQKLRSRACRPLTKGEDLEPEG